MESEGFIQSPELRENESVSTLSEILDELRLIGVNTLPESLLREHLTSDDAKYGGVPLTNDFSSGLRAIPKRGLYVIFTTNDLEDFDEKDSQYTYKKQLANFRRRRFRLE